MKKVLSSLMASALLFSCVPDKMENMEEQNVVEKILTNAKLDIPPGFSFESTLSTKTDISLDNTFTNENVKVQVSVIGASGNKNMIYDGFASQDRPLNEVLKIPNHISEVEIKGTYQGIEKVVNRSKADIRTVFRKSDFTASPQNKMLPLHMRSEYTFCEHGSKAKGDVEIFERVLVIKGSNKADVVALSHQSSPNRTYIFMSNLHGITMKTFNNNNFDCIFIYTGKGNDNVSMGSILKPSLINLGDGSDVGTGSSSAETIIYGGKGSDVITGYTSTDQLFGGNGVDNVNSTGGGSAIQNGDNTNCNPSCYSPVIDEDGDGYESIENGGVDVDDNNPNVVSRNYPQGQGLYHSLIFEDLWPCQGDYDFNDLILNYNVVEGKNGDNDITEIDFNFKVPALGGAFNNYTVLRVYDIDNNAALSRSDEESINVERVHDLTNQTTLFYFEDLKSYYSNNSAEVINTREKTFNTILELSGTVTGVDGMYDAFMLKDGDETAEVHPNVVDGIQGVSSFFNSELSGCHEGAVIDFKTDDGFPWGIVVPIEWQWPKEGIDILDAYPDFRVFVESSPGLDWYSSNNPNRVTNKIIQ